MVCRYDISGQLINTISYKNNIYKYCLSPRFITENYNGDAVFSSSPVVKLTGRDDKHRFFKEVLLQTDILFLLRQKLSVLMLCQTYLHVMKQMIDKGGHFLSFLLRKLHPEIISSPHTPYSLCYDNHRHLLFVWALTHDEVSVYRYINRDFTLLGKYTSRIIIYCFKY